MFHFTPGLNRRVPEAILSELKSAITNKLKFLVSPRYGYFSPYDVLSGPQTLLVTYNYRDGAPTNIKMLSKILKQALADPRCKIHDVRASEVLFGVHGNNRHFVICPSF